jgi:hypothetical protein
MRHTWSATRGGIFAQPASRRRPRQGRERLAAVRRRRRRHGWIGMSDIFEVIVLFLIRFLSWLGRSAVSASSLENRQDGCHHRVIIVRGSIGQLWFVRHPSELDLWDQDRTLQSRSSRCLAKLTTGCLNLHFARQFDAGLVRSEVACGGYC